VIVRPIFALAAILIPGIALADITGPAQVVDGDTLKIHGQRNFLSREDARSCEKPRLRYLGYLEKSIASRPPPSTYPAPAAASPRPSWSPILRPPPLEQIQHLARPAPPFPVIGVPMRRIVEALASALLPRRERFSAPTGA